MLKSLHIQNFAIVDEANVSFDDGLNVITGETGVGKSLIVDALGIALGERAFKDFIRDGYESAIVEAIFEISPADSKKLGTDNTTVAVKREIKLQGSSKVWINGQKKSVQELKELGDRLVDLHGQHEHQYLLNEEHHIVFLDQFAENDTLRRKVAKAFQELSSLLSELQERDSAASSRQEQLQLYEFQLHELNDINPQPGELEELEKERKVLENALTISEQASSLLNEVENADGSALKRMNQIIKQLEDLGAYTQSAASFLPEALAARVSLQSIADFAAEYEKEVRSDPKRLSEVESRVKVLNQICQKYNRSYPELLEYWEVIKDKLGKRDEPDWSREELVKSIEAKREIYSQVCAELSEKRKQEAVVLSKAIVDRLTHLGIPKGRFEIQVEQDAVEAGHVQINGVRYRGDASGMDRVTFWMQANPGEPLRPLARIASGGEISRIMLAIKSAMSGKDQIGTVIFDEIDTGISGRIARVVGKELQSLGKHHQLISITHLPQIASLADNHFRVEKQFINERTVTRVRKLNEDERVQEIATLIGDGAPGEATVEAARELLDSEE